MPRVERLQAGETIEEFAKRLGIDVGDLLRANPNFTSMGQLVEGFTLNLPEVAPVASSVVAAPTVAPSAAPTGEMTTDTSGLFNEMLKNFTQAFQTFLSAPSFIRNEQTARAGIQAGHPSAIGGFSQQEASFLREIEPELYSQYGEAVMGQFAATGKIPTLTAADFLKGINVKERMEMQTPGTTRANRRFGPPSIAPRRLRF